MRALAFLLFVLVAWLSPLLTPPALAAGCHFALGFQALHDRLPPLVGGCLGDESHNSTNGDALQHTTTGLLVWRKADNVAAFTNGRATWLEGPDGPQERANAARFAYTEATMETTLHPEAGSAGFIVA